MPPATRVDREALGRSRGGLSTKIHVLAAPRCRPLVRATTAGQRHDAPFRSERRSVQRVESVGSELVDHVADPVGLVNMTSATFGIGMPWLRAAPSAPAARSPRLDQPHEPAGR